MRFAIVSAAVVLLAGSLVAQVKPAPISGREMFLVEDEPRQRWCGYASRKLSRSEAERLKGEIVVGVEYSGDRVSALHVTRWDESGDWRVDDKYSLDKNQRLQALMRVTDNFSLGITEDQLFQIKNGTAVKESSASHASRTGTN